MSFQHIIKNNKLVENLRREGQVFAKIQDATAIATLHKDAKP